MNAQELKNEGINRTLDNNAAWKEGALYVVKNLPADWRGTVSTIYDSATMQQRFEAARLSDPVVRRADGSWLYLLPSVIDDVDMGVTDVVRGRDLFEATHIQRLIQTLMGWPAPRYRHHALLTDTAGRRYAKRDRSVTLAELRAGGMSAADLRAELGFSSCG